MLCCANQSLVCIRNQTDLCDRLPKFAYYNDIQNLGTKRTVLYHCVPMFIIYELNFYDHNTKLMYMYNTSTVCVAGGSKNDDHSPQY